MTKPLINRRQFVQLIAMSASMASGSTWAMSANKQQTDIAAQKTLGIDAELVYKDLADPWLSLAEVQEHLFPAEHSADASSPGARDICALRFLRNMLDAPDTDAEEKEFIIKGVPHHRHVLRRANRPHSATTSRKHRQQHRRQQSQ